jgi:hypothetical protein
MEKSTNGIIMAAAPAAMVALLLGVIAPGTALFGAQTATTDSVGPHGYVVVTVTRDGKEIYRHEDHNLITDAGKDFIAAQLGSTSPGTNGANYIALSSDTGAPAAGDTTLTGEITTGGLARSQGTYAHTAGTNTYTITEPFTASATHTNVQKAGLFTASSAGTMMAENTFTPVTLNSGDQLTITWTITLS